MAVTLEHKGAALGPMDPDNAGDLTKKLGVHNKATKLLKQHAANWPLELMRVLSLPRDDARSDVLDLHEVESALLELRGRRAFFDSEDVLEDASVRGTDRERWVTVVFTIPSGRTSYGAIPYTDNFAAAERRFEEAQAAEKGITLSAPLQAQLGQVEGGISEEDASKLEEDRTKAEEAARAAQAEADAAKEELERLRDPEPWEGYDGSNQTTILDRLKDGGFKEFGRLGLLRIQDYEARHQARKGIDEQVSSLLIDADAE